MQGAQDISQFGSQLPAIRFIIQGLLDDADKISADKQLNKAHFRYIEDIKKRGAYLLTIFDSQIDGVAPAPSLPPATFQSDAPVNQVLALTPLTKDEEDQLYSELKDIHTLNVEVGLSNVENNKEQYLKLLCRFCDNFDQWRSVIMKDMEIDYWKEYTMRFDIFVKIFEVLGNKNLLEWSAKLSAASRRGDKDFCENQTPTVCEAMSDFRDELLGTTIYKSDPNLKHIKNTNRRFIIETREEQAENLKRRVPLLIEKLKELRIACEDFRANDAKKIAWLIKNISIDEKIDALSNVVVQQVATIDYDKAVIQVKKLLAVLDAYLAHLDRK
ncbi:MAG: hypothetical protein LBS86_02805 [Treponema sp.]|jgi:hypothetical protein|nr:hypothetical protein [Treponema sp.]